MAIFSFPEIKNNAIIEIGKHLMLTAQTAPKGRGVDLLEILLITGDDIIKLSDEMKLISIEKSVEFFRRDAENILKAAAIMIISSPVKSLGLKYCGMCGFENCAAKEKFPETPCVFNTIDLGIAISSVVAKAGALGIDNRIMYTIGMAAKKMKICKPEQSIILGIPLSAEAKNPFFDRH
ncbi:MAG: ferredoxin [Bacteroidales bacterium]|nr:ferredoxin [Bacteroidales bacterium]